MGGSGGSGVHLARRGHYGVHRICDGNLAHSHEWVAGHHVLGWGAEPDVFGDGCYFQQQRVSVGNYRRGERSIRRHRSRNDCAHIQLSAAVLHGDHHGRHMERIGDRACVRRPDLHQRRDWSAARRNDAGLAATAPPQVATRLPAPHLMACGRRTNAYCVHCQHAFRESCYRSDNPYRHRDSVQERIGHGNHLCVGHWK